MSTLIIKSGTTSIAGAIVKGNFSYFSANTTTDLGPTSSTGLYSGIDAPSGGYTIYKIGGPDGWTARVATDTTSLNSILITYGATGTTLNQRITWATNTDSVFINSGATATYTVGQSALGGIIAYTTGGGTSGFVVTSTDVSVSATWGCQGTVITGADGAGIGSGNQNTIDIMAQCATAGIAARLCGDLVQGGYSDWYLPSSGELNQIFLNKTAIGGTFADRYWSSTEFFNSAIYAYFTDFNSGGSTPDQKSVTYNVRAIRSF
jgi:hypothetical protein